MTFFVDGVPVASAYLSAGVASVPYVFSAGQHKVTASYSGSASYAPVSHEAVVPAAVTAEGAAVPVAPPSFPPASPSPLSPAAAGVPRAASSAPRPAGEMARTGSDARMLVPLSAVLLIGGFALLCIRRRPSR